MKPERPQKGFLDQLSQIKRILDEDESLRALARIIAVILFLVVVVWLGTWLVPALENYADNLYDRLLRPTATMFPTPIPSPEATLPVTPEAPTPGGPTLTPTATPVPIPIQPPSQTLINRLRDFIATLKWETLRLAITPLVAFSIILLAAAYFIKDVYALPQLRMGLSYVFYSMFGTNYPRLVIDGGKKQLKEGEFNLLDKIGGPGYVVVQPGNAVLFSRLRGPSGVGITRSVFLKRFETISMIASLDEQHYNEEELGPITTKDGIKVTLRDINYRFRVVSSTPRSLQNPYPFDQEAIRKMAANRTVNTFGISSWRQNVNGMIRSALINYINDHTIDFLTAPREGGIDPRSDMRAAMMSERSLRTFETVGAELLWIDVGHIDINGSEVDAERVNFWAADWVGSADAARAFGDAKRQAYQEIARAEAQAEMIMGIAHSLENMNMYNDPGDNIRNILLTRTAQIIDAISHAEDQSEKKKVKRQNDQNE